MANLKSGRSSFEQILSEHGLSDDLIEMIDLFDPLKKINLSEKKVLVKMLSSPGKIFSRSEIGKIAKITKERSIDVMITRLRKKIEVDPKNPKFLQTIRGSGYVLWVK